MSNFEPNAVIRGFQLTVVGTVRALKNPDLFRYDHFRQAALAVAVGVIIHLLVQIPIIAIKLVIHMASLVSNLDQATWDDQVLNGLNFVSQWVLQVPFLMMTLMRYVTPTLDEIFMESLKWVDSTYVQKHRSEDPNTLRAMYYPNLMLYSTKGNTSSSKPMAKALMEFARRYARRAAMMLGIYLLSFLPVVGRFVMPAASFYTLHNSIGTVPAAVIFGTGLVLPKRLIASFLHTYFASRSLMRELLEPYFSRVLFTSAQKRRWFMDREGVLFGFAFGFTVILKAPFIGVLLYGVAEASTAYLITKITDPPPPPTESAEFVESQTTWKNKHDFLRLSLDNLDKYNVVTNDEDGRKKETLAPSPGRKFT